MIWFYLDKCASPSTEKPLTVLQLDKSEVYLRNPNGKSQTHQVCSVWKLLVSHKALLKKVAEEEIIILL